jgi:hypothetical protein
LKFHDGENDTGEDDDAGKDDDASEDDDAGEDDEEDFVMEPPAKKR